jgi:hypothetical protein
MSEFNSEAVQDDELESALRLLSDIQSLIATEHMSSDQKLMVIDRAITEAIGSTFGEARDTVQNAALGLIEP